MTRPAVIGAGVRATGIAAPALGHGPDVVDRVRQRTINEAARTDGVADAVTADTARTACPGHRARPLATADLVGLDNVVGPRTVRHERTGDDGYRPRATLPAGPGAGHLGRETGRGCHDRGTPA